MLCEKHYEVISLVLGHQSFRTLPAPDTSLKEKSIA